jgi:hypothetical protein
MKLKRPAIPVLLAILASGCAAMRTPPPVVISRPVDASLPAERRYVPIRSDLVELIPDPMSGRRLVTVGDWIEAAKARAASLDVANGRLAEIGKIEGQVPAPNSK